MVCFHAYLLIGQNAFVVGSVSANQLLLHKIDLYLRTRALSFNLYRAHRVRLTPPTCCIRSSLCFSRIPMRCMALPSSFSMLRSFLNVTAGARHVCTRVSRYQSTTDLPCTIFGKTGGMGRRHGVGVEHPSVLVCNGKCVATLLANTHRVSGMKVKFSKFGLSERCMIPQH